MRRRGLAPKLASVGSRTLSREGQRYDAVMATEPQRDPIEEEAARVLAENPGLREELEEFGRAYDAGEIPPEELVSDEEVRQRLAKVFAKVGFEDPIEQPTDPDVDTPEFGR